MSQQLLDRIRDHATALDQAAPPIRLDAVRASSRHATERRSRRILAIAAAAVLLVGGLVAIYAVRVTDRQPSAVPPSMTSEPSTVGDTAVWLPSTQAAAYGLPPVADATSISAASSSFAAHVMRLGCSGGETGTVLPPEINFTDTQIIVTFQVDALPEGVVHICPSNDLVTYEVELGEPIGQRQLVDGACRSAAAKTTLYCRNQGLRWSPTDGASTETFVAIVTTTTMPADSASPGTTDPTTDLEVPPPPVEQTTTTFGPTTTLDLEYLEAVNASWELTGSWLMYEPGVTDAELGFAVFAVDPFDVGRRFVSTGHGQCFLFSGRAVEADGLTHVVPIEAAATPGVECDPGPAPDTYTNVVECLQTGCRLDVQGDVLHLSTGAGEHLADLIRTTDEVPPRD